MDFPDVQQFVFANPLLVIAAAFVVGIVLVLAVRIVLETAHCLFHLGCAIVVIVVIILLLRLLLFR